MRADFSSMSKVDSHSTHRCAQNRTDIDFTATMFVFAIGVRLHDKWVGIVGAFLYAVTVFSIQMGHFATVDATANFFVALAIFAAVQIQRTGRLTYWLWFGFGFTPRIIAVALASGPMVMINAATGFRRVDAAKIALARSYGATTLQIFWKIRAPMALPVILVGLMIGAIFGLLTAVGAEMVGGGFGLGNRLTTYSSMINMPEFFAVIVILSTLGILIYVFFFLVGKKWASWEA